MSNLVKTAFRADADDLTWFKRKYRSVGYNRVIRLLMARHRHFVESKDSAKKKETENGIELDASDLELRDGDLSGD